MTDFYQIVTESRFQNSNVHNVIINTDIAIFWIVRFLFSSSIQKEYIEILQNDIENKYMTILLWIIFPVTSFHNQAVIPKINQYTKHFTRGISLSLNFETRYRMKLVKKEYITMTPR